MNHSSLTMMLFLEVSLVTKNRNLIKRSDEAQDRFSCSPDVKFTEIHLVLDFFRTNQLLCFTLLSVKPHHSLSTSTERMNTPHILLESHLQGLSLYMNVFFIVLDLNFCEETDKQVKGFSVCICPLNGLFSWPSFFFTFLCFFFATGLHAEVLRLISKPIPCIMSI